MLHIIGRPSDQKILEVVWMKCLRGGVKVPINYREYKKSLTINYGNDWFLFKANEKSDVSKRIERGDKWEAVWKKNKIVSIFFKSIARSKNA